MAVTFLEPGGDADFLVGTTNGFWSGGTIGSPAAVADFVHGGHKRSIRYSAALTEYVVTPVVIQDSGTRFSFYLYLKTLPNSTTTIIFLLNSTPLVVASLKLTSAGIIQLFGVTTQIGSNGATLATGTWYRICIAYTVTSTTVNEFRVFVNGSSSISVTNATITNTGSQRIRLGNLIANTTLELRTSDHYVDDSSSLTDTGDIWVTAKRPFSNGSSNQFTTQIGAGGSGYGSGHSPQVNERSLDITDGWSLSNTTVQTEEYTIESASSGDIDITGTTIIDYSGWISAKVASTSNSPVHHILVGGVSTAKTMTTNPGMFTQIAGSSTYPAGNTDIGMDAAYTTTPHLTSLFECGILIAYIPIPLISVFDTLTTTESKTTSNTMGSISVTETLTTTESVTRSGSSSVSVVETLTTTESVTVAIFLNISVSDAITITESLTLIRNLIISVVETLTTTESVTISNPGGSINIFDSIIITETVQRTLLQQINIYDAITLSESLNQTEFFVVNVFDSITLSENFSNTDEIASIFAYESITITETLMFEFFHFSPSLPGKIVGSSKRSL